MEPWIQTYTGQKVNVFEPFSNVYTLEDIARSLSYQCRYNGHTKFFYSVAHHSLALTTLVSDENVPYALLHDASEAYLPDLPKPIKENLPEYKNIDSELQRAILTYFGLKPELPEEVVRLDRQIQYTEKHKVLPVTDIDWGWSEPLLNVTIAPIPIDFVHQEFLQVLKAVFQ